MNQLQEGELLDVVGEENVLPIQRRIEASIEQAYAQAQHWIEEHKTD